MTTFKPIPIILSFVFSFVFVSETIAQELSSNIEKVTLFLDGAQVFRQSKTKLNAGKTLLRFENLSSKIDPHSIQVKAPNGVLIQSVKHELDYMSPQEQSEENQVFLDKIEELVLQVDNQNVELSILNKKVQLLEENKHFVSKDKAISPVEYNQFLEIYNGNYEAYQRQIHKQNTNLKHLNKELQNLRNQQKDALSSKAEPKSVIMVSVSTKTVQTASFTFSYFVSDVHWYPSYDVRVNDNDEDLVLVYKANVSQRTGVDWKGVRLSFSNSNPLVNSQFGSLNPYRLSKHYVQQKRERTLPYNASIRRITGRVLDETGETLPTANVVVFSETDKILRGTSADFDGNFILEIPEGGRWLEVSFVGYAKKRVPIGSSYQEIVLEDGKRLSAVTISNAPQHTLSGLISNDDKSQTVRGGRVESNSYIVDGVRMIGSNSVPVSKSKELVPLKLSVSINEAQVNFDLDIPYDLASKSELTSIDMIQMDVPSQFVFKSAPKLDQQAFLIAQITDWEDLNLMGGTANLYYNNTFVGQSQINPKQLNDTLELSLGVDKSISIERKQIDKLCTEKFIKSNRIIEKTWSIQVRNNKSSAVKLLLYDQIPLSEHSSVDVEFEAEGAKHNKKTGELKWELNLKPKETKTIQFKYKVKLPRSLHLQVN